MPKTTNFADCRRFAANVSAAGGKLPPELENLIRAHSVLADATAIPAASQRPEAGIVDEALAGTLTSERLAELLPAAASAAAVNAYAKDLAGSVERVLLGAWHREMEAGGADFVLDSMRPLFDKHQKAVAKARSLFSAESTAESVLSSAPAEVVEAWQSLSDHLTVIAKIALVAREFGPRLGSYPMITEYAGGDGHTLTDEAIMVADGGLQIDSAAFMRPDRGHKDSPLFRVPLRLHSIESARSRYAQWAADQWDGINGGRDRGGYIDQATGEVHKFPALENPFRAKTSVR